MGEKVFYNTCPAAGCHQYCATKVWVKDGKIFKIESADYPEEPDARMVCLRGLSSLRFVYHPDRLKYPMKRAGQRGEGKWQRITWDEAFDTIAGKLLEIKEKYGAHAVKVISGGSSSVGLINGLLIGIRFANTWGAGGAFEAKGYFSDGGAPAASLLILGVSGQTHDDRDFLNSMMLILWGLNAAVTNYLEMKSVLDARDKGVKLVVIGPVFDPTAAKADLWVALRAGTDAALALAMINTIIKQGLHNKDYIAKYTVGPFLVGEHTKLFLREDGKHLVWDEKTGKAMPCDAASSPALLGNFTVKGSRCQTAFQLLKERAAQYPSEKASEITGVPAETITKLAVEYATSKPSAIKMGYGMTRSLHSNQGCRAIITLAAITGNIGISGGGASSPLEATPVTLNNNAVISPPGAPGSKTIPGSRSATRGWIAIREGKPYPIKALLCAYNNNLISYGNINGYLEIFSKMDLITVADVFMTRTAKYADIVLPEATIFERDDVAISHNHVLRMEKAIEPLYESRPAWEIWSELARRVGLGEYFQHTAQDYIKMLLESKNPSLAGITAERLEKEKIVRAKVPFIPEIPFGDKRFPTPSGRIEFYQEKWLEFGEELPLHKEPLESPRTSPLAQRYPLSLLTIKSRITTQTILANIDWLEKLEKVEPKAILDINPQDAQKRGIKDGDMVAVFNDRGKVKLKAMLNQSVPPGTVNTYHGSWPEHFAEGHYNDLLYRVDDLTAINPSLEIEPIVSDSKAAANYNSYDCLVEVKKDRG